MTYRTGDERPVINIEGELVALGPLRRDLLQLYQRWINDLVAARGLGAFLPITVEKEIEGEPIEVDHLVRPLEADNGGIRQRRWPGVAAARTAAGRRSTV